MENTIWTFIIISLISLSKTHFIKKIIYPLAPLFFDNRVEMRNKIIFDTRKFIERKSLMHLDIPLRVKKIRLRLEFQDSQSKTDNTISTS